MDSSIESRPFTGKAPKLLLIHLRYYPPGIVLEYSDHAGKIKEKTIELLDLTCATNNAKLCTKLLNTEPIFTTNKHRMKLMESLEKLKNKCIFDYNKKYISLKTIKAHSLPLTDACLSKDGQRCVTSSLGNACKIWCTHTGKELGTLVGHKDAVVSVAFNPRGDRVLSSSHDGTLRHWSCGEDGVIYCNQVLPASENGSRVLFAKYGPDYQMAVSATDDHTACVHDLVNGVTMYKFSQDEQSRQELNSVNLDRTGTLLLVSPQEHQAALWDLRSGELAGLVDGHEMEITKSIFDFSSQLIATASLDSFVKLWDMRMMNDSLNSFCCDTEVLDIEFDFRGKSLAAGTADGKLFIWNVNASKAQFERQAHKSSISKIGWSPNGSIVLTCSELGTIRLYHSEMGTCLQTLPDHTREIVNASFNYTSDYLLTASKDKTVRIHKHTMI